MPLPSLRRTLVVVGQERSVYMIWGFLDDFSRPFAIAPAFPFLLSKLCFVSAPCSGWGSRLLYLGPTCHIGTEDPVDTPGPRHPSSPGVCRRCTTPTYCSMPTAKARSASTRAFGHCPRPPSDQQMGRAHFDLLSARLRKWSTFAARWVPETWYFRSEENRKEKGGVEKNG